jgi:hypothetical protein
MFNKRKKGQEDPSILFIIYDLHSE